MQISGIIKMAVVAFHAAVFLWNGVDAQARPVVDDTDTTRVVSLVPNLTELAFTLGAGGQVVGVSNYCYYPAEAQSRPKVGALINPNMEAILRLQPDVVLLYRSQTDFAGRLRQLGIRSELFSVDTLADLHSAIHRLGQEIGDSAAAIRLSQSIKSSLAGLAPDSGTTRTLTGVLIVSRDPSGLRNMYQASSANFLGELFHLVGGQLAIPDQPPVTAEAIIRANPDVIIDFSYGASATPTDILPAQNQAPLPFTGPWARLNTITAVRNAAVYKWVDPQAMLLGPGVVDTAHKMKQLLNSAY